MPIARIFQVKPWELLKCRLCRRITVIVCLSILAVEAAILMPSYLRLRANLYERLESDGLIATSFLLQGLESSPLDERLNARALNILGTTVRGVTFYDGAAEVASFGEPPLLSPAEHRRDGTGARGGRHRREVLWDAGTYDLRYTAVASLDTSGVEAELVAFVLRVGGLVLIITVFVSAVTVAAHGALVLGPLLRIRETLLEAQQDPANAERYKLDISQNDEIGETVATINTLLERLSEARRVDVQAREQRLKDFVDASSDWFWEMDENLRFSYFSDRFTEVSGVAQEMLLGKTREETGIPNVDPGDWQAHLATLRDHRPFRNFVHPRKKADGSVVWLSVNGKPVFDGQGRFTGYRGTGSNITKLKTAEERAERAQRQFLEAIESITEGFALFDSSDRLVLFNSRYLEEFHAHRDVIKVGATFEQLLRRSIEAAISSDTVGEDREAWFQWRMAQHRNPGAALELELADGRILKLSEVKTPEGGTVLITADITELKRRERQLARHRDHLGELVAERTAELREHRDHLEELVAARTAEVERQAAELEQALKAQMEYSALQREFVSMASHEFRTPLTIIDGAAQRLLRRMDRLTPAEMGEKLGNIREAVARMVTLIESTLSAARLNAGTIEMKPQPIELGHLLETVCARQRELSSSHRIGLDQERLPTTVAADPRLLEQVFTNLLSNAVKYSPDGPEVRVSARSDGGHVIVAVSDSGVGISSEDLPRIFQRYFRAKSAAGIAGTGIGLNLAKELVEMHGGSIEVESREGEGTTFTVRLPVDGPEGPLDVANGRSEPPSDPAAALMSHEGAGHV